MVNNGLGQYVLPMRIQVCVHGGHAEAADQRNL